MNCKHCRNEITDGQKTVLITAMGKTRKWRAYVHQTCTVTRLARNMFTKPLIAQMGF